MPEAPTAARPPSLGPLLAVVLALGIGGGWLLGRASPSTSADAPGPNSITAAERMVAPAVVKIEVASARRAPRTRFNLPPGLAPPQIRNRVQRSLGSGLIVDSSGYIVTNRHVVNRAQQISVSVPGDSHVYFAKLAGMDTETDLAVIKISAPYALPTARLGDSRQLQVGQWVVAIGSPFDLDGSVTAGIVSALHRAVDPNQQFENFIQTDAAINPGNSGGPLLTLDGQVVGINTSIYTATDGYQGVGFALPSDLVSKVYPQLEKKGHVTRGSIGVYFESALDPAVRRVYHVDSGVPISQVAPKGPAALAGIQAGDIITSLDGAPTADGDSLMNAVEFLPLGRTLKVGYIHNGAARTAKVTVMDRDQIYPDLAPQPPRPQPLPDAGPDLGMAVKDAASGGGVQVTDVASESFADDMGIRPDDVITEVNRQPVRTRADLDRLLRAVPRGSDLALLLRRPNGDGTDSRWLVGGTLPPAQ